MRPLPGRPERVRPAPAPGRPPKNGAKNRVRLTFIIIRVLEGPKGLKGGTEGNKWDLRGSRVDLGGSGRPEGL